MSKFKEWFLVKMIALCNYGLSFSDAAEDQGEVNEMIKTKNYFIVKLAKIQRNKGKD